jgi:hypothetical protein
MDNILRVCQILTFMLHLENGGVDGKVLKGSYLLEDDNLNSDSPSNYAS